MNSIFLSASIPTSSRDHKYYNTTDVLAIREAIKALTTVVIPKSILVWGGHPAITPIISTISDNLNIDCKKHLILYQSSWFKDSFPEENNHFQKVIFTKKKNDRKSSLIEMRNKMIESYDYKAGIFIGGMEGVEEEFNQFRFAHPKAKVYPISSTGGAAKILYEKYKNEFPDSLENELTYMNLFKSLLNNIIE